VARLIALEGIDGSGKGTQAALLHAALQRAGHECALLSFPRYQQTQFGRKIGDFLNGKYGTLDQVHPVLVSLLFAGDRLESKPLIEQSLARCEFVICDRYVPSNMAHQAAKAPATEREELLSWIEFVEYELYRLPRADAVIWLDMPVPAAQELILRKQKRAYTDRAADLQEADATYLEQVRQVYARLATRDATWRRIDCCADGRIRETDDVAAEIAAIMIPTA